MAGSQSPGIVAARLVAWLRERVPFDADAPLPVDALIERLGIEVTSFDATIYPDVLGYLEPGEDLIFLRAGLSEPVRRFTLAHELGHVALHRRSGLAAEIGATSGGWSDDAAAGRCDDFDLAIPDGGEDETLRPGQAYSARAQREGEANTFAAALLLPAATARAAYEALCARDVERPALALAHQFGVSEDVALRRLTALLTQPTDEAATPATVPIPSPLSPAALDSDQRRAARAKTPALIVAGPGSGKTSALLGRIAYLVDQRGVAPERILALTFSRKAAEEMRNRAMGMLGEGSAAPRVSTIHAFCGDILRHYGPLVGLRTDFRLVTDVEGYFLLRRIVNQAPLTHYTPLGAPTMYFRDLLGAISRAKDDLISPAEYRAAAEAMARAAETPEGAVAAERALEVAEVYTAYQAALAARGDVDYGDLIAKMVALLREAPGEADEIRGRYEHILVDEFQDINHAMGELLRELAGRRGPIWAVGDVDQAIYRFRGGSPASMLRFARDFDGAKVIPLGRNYRSRPLILRAANAFAEAYLPAEGRVALEPTRGDAPGQPVVALAIAPDVDAELDGLAQAMRERAEAGTPLREQVALLRTRANVRQVCAGLRLRGVPARLATPLFDHALIKALLATVGLAADPLASGLLRAGELPDHPFSDEDVRALFQLARERRISPFEALRSDEALRALTPQGMAGLRRLERIVAELRGATTVAVGVSRYVFSLTTLGRRLLADDAQLDAGHVARLLAICRTFDDQREMLLAPAGEGGAPLMADWAGLRDYIDALRALGSENGTVELASDEDAALVMTAHAAKGLEFSAVYLPQLSKGRFPKEGKDDTIPAPPGLLREDAELIGDDEREEANLFYVSLTRARDLLTLSYGPRRGKAAPTPSPFLAPIEQALGEELIHLRWEGGESAAPQKIDADVGDAPGAAANPSDAAARVFSIHQLEAYHRCPQRYAYEYVYGLRPALAAPASLSESYKAASADIARGFALGDPPTLEQAIERFDEAWSVSRANALRLDGASAVAEGDEPLSPVYRQHGQRAIERLWRTFQEGDAPVNAVAAVGALGVGASVRVSVSLGSATITGGLDHVEDASSQAGRVSRFQNGKLASELNLRDLFYALASEEMRQSGRPATVMRVSLADGEVKPLNISRQRQRLERVASEALAGLISEQYPPRPDARKCATCPFALICPA